MEVMCIGRRKRRAGRDVRRRVWLRSISKIAIETTGARSRETPLKAAQHDSSSRKSAPEVSTKKSAKLTKENRESHAEVDENLHNGEHGRFRVLETTL